MNLCGGRMANAPPEMVRRNGAKWPDDAIYQPLASCRLRMPNGVICGGGQVVPKGRTRATPRLNTSSVSCTTTARVSPEMTWRR